MRVAIRHRNGKDDVFERKRVLKVAGAKSMVRGADSARHEYARPRETALKPPSAYQPVLPLIEHAKLRGILRQRSESLDRQIGHVRNHLALVALIIVIVQSVFLDGLKAIPYYPAILKQFPIFGTRYDTG